MVVTYFSSQIVINKFMRENGFDFIDIEKKYFYENLDYYFNGGTSNALTRPKDIIEEILNLTYKLKKAQKIYLQEI